MAGYTRQSSFTDGDVITASHSNDEFNQILAAFVNTSGHKHDGTAAEGPVIGLIGDPGVATPLNKVVVDNTNNRVGVFVDAGGAGSTVEQVRFQDGAILPVTNNDVDLGSSSVKFKELHLAGAANIAGTMTLSGNVIVSGTLGADLIPDGDNTRDIGSTSAEWKDLYIDGVAYVDAINFNGTAISATAAEINILDGVTASTSELNIMDGVTATTSELNIMDGVTATTAELNLMDGGTSAGTTAVAGGDGIVTNDGGTMRQTTVDTFDTYLSQTTKTLTNKTLTTPVIAEIDNASDITLDAGGDIILDAGGANIVFKDDGTSILDIANNSSDVELTVSTADKNFAIKGTDGSSAITALDIDMALAGKATFSGDVVVTGDLTVTGDDITMATNTAGHMLVGDGTNYNPVAISGDVTMASSGAVTIASGAVEGSMLAASVITGQTQETTVDTSNDLVLMFDNSASALRKVPVTNLISAAGGLSDVVSDTSPQLGGDLDVNGNDIVSVSNGDINLLPNGSGKVIIDGNGSSGGVSITDGLIDIRTGTGDVTKVKFYCESSNAHAQTLQAQPHSASSSAVLTLPVATGTLIGTGDSGTVSNGMLAGSIADSKLSTISTAGKVDIGALEIDGGTDIGADLVDADLLIVDDGANGTERKSEFTRVKKYIYSAMSGDATASDAGALTIANDAVESGMLNDNIISGQTELASGLADTDELLVSDAGTIKRMDLSVVKTYLTNAGFSSEDPTALAIALG
jgi:hypothetical protein